MNLNNIFKKVSGIALAGTLAVSGVSSVFAAETSPAYTGQPTGITKTLQVRDGVAIPNETFNFTVAPTTEGPAKAGMEAAPAGFVSLANNGQIQFGNDESNEKTLGLTFDFSKITKPGIYRVAIAETAGSRQGMTYDEAVRYADFYVVRGENGFNIANVIVSNAEGVKQQGNETQSGNGFISFTNRYGVNEDGTDDNSVVQDLVVGKVISKDSVLYEADKEFAFTVSIQGEVGDKFTYNGQTQEITEAGNPVTFTVTAKDGETKTISGLTADDTVTVVETDESKTGYTATGEVNQATALSSINDNTVIVTNTSETSVPTGIIENIAPFALAIAAAGIVFFIYFKRDKEEEQLA